MNGGAMREFPRAPSASNDRDRSMILNSRENRERLNNSNIILPEIKQGRP